MSAPAFDLQSHSIVSDGALRPDEVVERAAAAGVEVLALTDHDAVDGVDAALEAGAAHGVRIVPASELSALDGDQEDLHVCAYLVDHRAPRLLDALREFRADRNARGGRMLDALQGECGFRLDRTAIDARAASGKPVGRPHLAEAVWSHPDNAARLREEGLGDPGAVLEAYLTPGRPAYRRRTTPTVPEAIALVHECGGLAVWAHPYWDLDDPAAVEATLERFAADGIDGVEAFYVAHDETQTRHLAEVADRLGLLTTGSSDFHGPGHGHFSEFRAFELFGLEPRLGPIATA